MQALNGLRSLIAQLGHNALSSCTNQANSGKPKKAWPGLALVRINQVILFK